VAVSRLNSFWNLNLRLNLKNIFFFYFQVGNSEKVHLPLETEVPPPQRLRSVSQTSLTSDYDDSDEDFIVFEKVSASFIS
jgi:hypothetical protein